MPDAGDNPTRPSGAGQESDLPLRLSGDRRVATWNPGLARASHVILRVRSGDGTIAERLSMNSGRARVREGELIISVRAAAED
jgi:hypothetical protein